MVSNNFLLKFPVMHNIILHFRAMIVYCYKEALYHASEIR